MTKQNAITTKIAKNFPDLVIKNIVYTEFGAIVFTTNHQTGRTEVLTIEIKRRQTV